MKTNRKIHQVVEEVLTKYQKRGGNFKLFNDIFLGENIKFKEVNSRNPNFVGALTEGINGQKYIMVNANIDNVGRKNFTIAHELGHYFLKHQLKENYNYCSIKDIREEGNYINNIIEREANYFASCFLMPEEMLKEDFKSIYFKVTKNTVKDLIIISNNSYKNWIAIRDNLIKCFGVSEAALRYRLQNLGLVKFEFEE